MKKINIFILLILYIKSYSITELTFNQEIIYTNNLFYDSNKIKDIIWLNSFNLDYEKNNLLISVTPSLFLLYNNPKYKSYKILSYINYIINDNKKNYSDISMAYNTNNFIENKIYNINEYYLNFSTIFYLEKNNEIELNLDYIKKIFQNLNFLNNNEINFSSSFSTKNKKNNLIFTFILGEKKLSEFSKYKNIKPGKNNNNQHNQIIDLDINKITLNVEIVKNINLLSGLSIKYSKNMISNKYSIWPLLYNNLYFLQEWDDDFASNFDKITLKYNLIKFCNHSLEIEYLNKKYNQIKLFNRNQFQDSWKRNDNRLTITYNINKYLILFNKESFLNLKTLFFKNNSNINIFNYNNLEIKLSLSIKLI